MIKRVTLDNYKSCHQASLDDIGAFTVLVGRNGAGKSNILQAINWLARIATSASQVQFFQLEEYSAAIEFESGGRRNRYAARVSWSRPANEPEFEETWSQHTGSDWQDLVSRRNTKITVSRRPEEIRVAALTPCLMAVKSLLPDNDELLAALSPVLSFLESVRYYPMDESVATRDDQGGGSFVIANSAYVAWLNESTSRGRSRDDVHLKLLHMWLTDQQKFKEFTDLLGPQGLGLIDDVHIEKYQPPQPSQVAKGDPPNHFYFTQFLPAGSRPPTMLPYSGLSHGTRRILRIVLAVVFDQSSVMLLEHPEDGIHPGLLHKLMSVLQSYSDPLQTIAASHSPEVFNSVNPGDIRLVSMTEDGTKARALSGHEISMARKYMSEEGVFSDFLNSLQGQ